MTLRCDKAKAGRLRTNNYLLKLVEVSPQPDSGHPVTCPQCKERTQNTTECPLSLPTQADLFKGMRDRKTKRNP